MTSDPTNFGETVNQSFEPSNEAQYSPRHWLSLFLLARALDPEQWLPPEVVERGRQEGGLTLEPEAAAVLLGMFIPFMASQLAQTVLLNDPSFHQRAERDALRVAATTPSALMGDPDKRLDAEKALSRVQSVTWLQVMRTEEVRRSLLNDAQRQWDAVAEGEAATAEFMRVSAGYWPTQVLIDCRNEQGDDLAALAAEQLVRIGWLTEEEVPEGMNA
jgi:hypothetical protein